MDTVPTNARTETDQRNHSAYTCREAALHLLPADRAPNTPTEQVNCFTGRADRSFFRAVRNPPAALERLSSSACVKSSGQFGWLESLTDLRITDAIADWLIEATCT